MTKEKSEHKEKIYVIGAGIDKKLLAERLHKEGYREDNYDIIVVDSKDEIPGAGWRNAVATPAAWAWRWVMWR